MVPWLVGCFSQGVCCCSSAVGAAAVSCVISSSPEGAVQQAPQATSAASTCPSAQLLVLLCCCSSCAVCHVDGFAVKGLLCVLEALLPCASSAAADAFCLRAVCVCCVRVLFRQARVQVVCMWSELYAVCKTISSSCQAVAVTLLLHHVVLWALGLGFCLVCCCRAVEGGQCPTAVKVSSMYVNYLMCLKVAPSERWALNLPDVPYIERSQS